MKQANADTPSQADTPAAITVAPRPQLDRVTLPDSNVITIDVLANDTIAGSQALTILSVTELDDAGNEVSGPGQAIIEIIDNKVRYTFTGTRIGVAGGTEQSTAFMYTVNGVGNPLSDARTAFVIIDIPPPPPGPTGIALSNTVVDEGISAPAIIGELSMIGGKTSGSSFFPRFFLPFDPINDATIRSTFSIRNFGTKSLIRRADFDFEERSSYTIRLSVMDSDFNVTTQDFEITVRNVNERPTDIRLSNARIDENQPAGTTVGTLSSVDSDSSNHTYALVDGFSDDNDLFEIQGSTLRTAAVLDFETKASHVVNIQTTDDQGASFERSLTVQLNNIPSPPDAPQNTLSFCSGETITLIERNSGRSGSRVLVQVTDVSISNLQAKSCRVTGKMSVTTNGETADDIDFSGTVNERNQFASAEVDDFKIGVAGLTLAANSVEVEYRSDQARLHITEPELKLPREFGGLTARLSIPTSITEGGLQFGVGTITLPTITTSSGFELSVSGSLRTVGDGFQIDADGTLGLPNISKKSLSSQGQTCAIDAGVTIFVDAQGRTVMAIAAGKDYHAVVAAQAELRQLAMGSNTPSSPDATEDLRLGAVRAAASCDPGLAIGTTGLFLTGLGGEVTLTPGEEQVDVEVTIEAGKSLPVLGPVVALDGEMSLRVRPRFQLDLGGTLNVLVLEMAKADATVKSTGFRARIQTTQIFGIVPVTTDVRVAAFTQRSQFIFTGSGRVAIEVKEGMFGETCIDFSIFGELCTPLPPFSLGTLAAARAEVGQFTNRLFGIKGVVTVIGISQGFFIDEEGSFTVRNVDRFKLVRGPFVAAARAQWQEDAASGEAVHAAAYDGYTFLEQTDDFPGGVVINTPLERPSVDLTQVASAGATDIISQVNLIQNGDVIFRLLATEPLDFTLINPGGQEVTPANYWDESAVGYEIEYTDHVSFVPVTSDAGTSQTDEPEGDYTAATGQPEDSYPRIRITPLSYEPVFANLDFRIDGGTIYYGLGPEDAVWLEPLPILAGEHTVELVRSGTEDVVLSGTLDFQPDTSYSLVTVGGPSGGLGVMTNDTAAPETLGKAKVRFFNGADTQLTLLVNGTPLHSNFDYYTLSESVEVDAGAATIEVRFSNNTPASATLNVDLANGGVYTFFATEDLANMSPGFDIYLLQQEDALYSPLYWKSYAIDQARFNENWQVKLVGDTDNADFEVAVEGSPSPPILASVTMDASNLAKTRVSWQLTSDRNPTTIQVYATAEEISASFTITQTDGSLDTEELPVYEGELIAEFEITDLNELGGQAVTKEVDLSGLASGTYHVWVRADDGVNPPATTYATALSAMAAGTSSIYGMNAVRLAQNGYAAATEFANAQPIAVDQAASFPQEWTATITPVFDSATNSLEVEWNVIAHPDVDTYRLLVGNTPLAPTEVFTVGGALTFQDEAEEFADKAVGVVTLRNINPDTPYFISIEAIDSESGRTVRSQEVEFSVASTPFALTSANSVTRINPGSTANIPVTLSADGELFFPNVWLSTDLGAAPLGISARFVDDIDGVLELSSEIPSRTLEVNVDASVPLGRYPIVVKGYNGIIKEELTLTIDVSDGSTSTSHNIYLPFATR